MSETRLTEAECMRARLEDAQEAWGWHDADENRREGHGYHMSQMLYRLPMDGQARDMQASIEQMLADLDTALYRLVKVEALVDQWHHPDHGGSCWGCAVDRALSPDESVAGKTGADS